MKTKQIQIHDATLHEPVNEFEELRAEIEALKNQRNPLLSAISQYVDNFRNSPLTSISGIFTGGTMMYQAYQTKDIFTGVQGLGLFLGLTGANENNYQNVSNNSQSTI
ncbi:MAG: hypothetical protein MUF58_11795 [Arcicella sp.]|jgi:hypothetical protein|nr:hypothetical protein [Arcicella sp.]